jgi:hypothetical protein
MSDLAQGGRRPVDPAVLEQVEHRARIRRDGEPGHALERREERPEGEEARRTMVEEGLLAEPISGAEEGPAGAIEDDEREHPVEALDAGRPPGAVGLGDDLRVRRRREPRAARLQLGAQLAMVVDLAVVGDDEPIVHRRERHLDGADVDDREPIRADREAPLHARAVTVRASMPHAAQHLVHGGPELATRGQPLRHDARDAAHPDHLPRASRPFRTAASSRFFAASTFGN